MKPKIIDIDKFYVMDTLHLFSRSFTGIRLVLGFSLRSVGFLCLLALSLDSAVAQQRAVPLRLQPAAKTKGKEPAGQEYSLNPLVAPFFGQVKEVKADGEIEVAPPDDLAPQGLQGQTELIEGWYLGVAQETPQSPLQGARLFRVKVTEVKGAGKATLQVAAPAVKKLKTSDFLMLFRPTQVTTAQMAALPDFAQIEDEGAAEPAGDMVSLKASFNNLKQIGLALHNFHDAHNRFPPASISGPDGKPWHSWRVLLLPYLDQSELYNQYKFDEPWDGPNNKKLHEKIPAVYQDPIHGKNPNHYTHYVAIRGEGMGFEEESVEFDGTNVSFSEGIWIADFTDGTSNTLIVGPATPDDEIPWLKPDDFTVGDSISDLGKKDSFPTPFRIEGKKVAPFLRCDGSVVGLKEGTAGELLHQALTRNGGEFFDWQSFPSVQVGGNVLEQPVITIVKSNDGVKAKVKMVPLDVTQSLMIHQH